MIIYSIILDIYNIFAVFAFFAIFAIFTAITFIHCKMNSLWSLTFLCRIIIFLQNWSYSFNSFGFLHTTHPTRRHLLFLIVSLNIISLFKPMRMLSFTHLSILSIWWTFISSFQVEALNLMEPLWTWWIYFIKFIGGILCIFFADDIYLILWCTSWIFSLIQLCGFWPWWILRPSLILIITTLLYLFIFSIHLINLTDQIFLMSFIEVLRLFSILKCLLKFHSLWWCLISFGFTSQRFFLIHI